MNDIVDARIRRVAPKVRFLLCSQSGMESREGMSEKQLMKRNLLACELKELIEEENEEIDPKKHHWISTSSRDGPRRCSIA